MGRVGRNDPCPCGSGKKYKACHLRLDEAAQPGSTVGAPEVRLRHARLCEEIVRFGRKRLGEAAVMELMRSWPGDRELVRAEALVAWATFHADHQGRTLADRFREGRWPQLAPADRELLDASLQSRFSIFRVAGSTLTDALSGEAVQLAEAVPWGPSAEGAFILARPVAGIAQFGWAPLPAERGMELIDKLKAALGPAATQTAIIAAFEAALAEQRAEQGGPAVVHERIAASPERLAALREQLDALRASDPELRIDLFDDAVEIEAVGQTSEAARERLAAVREKLGLATVPSS